MENAWRTSKEKCEGEDETKSAYERDEKEIGARSSDQQQAQEAAAALPDDLSAIPVPTEQEMHPASQHTMYDEQYQRQPPPQQYHHPQQQHRQQYRPRMMTGVYSNSTSSRPVPLAQVSVSGLHQSASPRFTKPIRFPSAQQHHQPPDNEVSTESQKFLGEAAGTRQYPVSLRSYIERAYRACEGAEEREKLENYLRQRVEPLLKSGAIYAVNWAKEPLPHELNFELKTGWIPANLVKQQFQQKLAEKDGCGSGDQRQLQNQSFIQEVDDDDGVEAHDQSELRPPPPRPLQPPLSVQKARPMFQSTPQNKKQLLKPTTPGGHQISPIPEEGELDLDRLVSALLDDHQQQQQQVATTAAFAAAVHQTANMNMGGDAAGGYVVVTELSSCSANDDGKGKKGRDGSATTTTATNAALMHALRMAIILRKMKAAEAAPQTTTAKLLTAADSAVQSSNVELRERFLRILEWLPSRSVSAQMFGGIRLEGELVAVDPTNFDYYLVNNLKTPMGVVEHAALRTRDTIYLEIALDDADEEDEGKIVEQQQQQLLDNTAKVPDEGGEQRP
uniref:Uncharacterized protein n=1 Tax=Globodera rostochiensis TaxID=31243 RepID=A0A914GWQ0_GLORO